jgi:hypothetical protein
VPIDKSALLQQVKAEEETALGYHAGLLASDRARAIDYFNSQPVGKLAVPGPGRSSYVSSDVADTINSIMPALMRIFMAGDEVVSFNPHGPEDVKAAEQESDYVNYVVTQQNQAFLSFHNWFHDTLLTKVGYVKYRWEELTDRVRDTYEGLTGDELALLLQDKDVKPLAQNQRQIQVQMPQGPQDVTVYDIRVERSKKSGQVRFDVVPPEEILVARRSRSVNIKEAPFVQHRTKRTISSLREDGYQVEDTVSDEDESLYRPETLARRTTEEQLFWDQQQGGMDASTREVLWKESYFYADIDDDGIAELVQMCHIGDEVYSLDEVTEIPLASLCAYPQPHKHHGKSVADWVMDIQELKSDLMRQIIDNTRAGNLGRYAVDSNRVNFDDLLNGRVNGIVRVDGQPGGSILPITPSPIAGQAFPLIEMLEGAKENRTGVTRYNQGLDSDSLNKTATGITKIMNAAQEKIHLIARVFAETGVKDLFVSVHALLAKHQRFESVVRLRNEWSTVNPANWQMRKDMTITVGIGNGDRQDQMQFMQLMLQAQEKAAPIGIASPQNIYNALIKLSQLGGFKNYNDYWTSPDKMPPKEPQPTPEQVKAQADAQKTQATIQADLQKANIAAGVDIQVAQIGAETERYKADKQAETDFQKAQLQAELDAQSREHEVSLQLAGEQANGAIQQQNTQALATMLENLQQQNAQAMQTMAAAIAQFAQQANAPKRVIRGADGLIQGTAPVEANP